MVSDSDDGLDPYELNEPSDDLDALADAAEGFQDANRPLPPGVYPQDADGRIDTDLPCIHCDYNLRGQSPTSSCPECGVPVQVSMRSDRLSEANPQWLAQMSQGANWLFAAGIGSFLLACGGGCLGTTAAASDPIAGAFVEAAFATVQAILFGVGYWRITTPEPGVMRPRVSRPIARWTTLPGYAVSPIASLIAISQSPPLQILSDGIDVLGGIAVAVGLFASLVYLRHLSRRIPDRGLAKQTTIVIWGWAILLGIVFLGVIVIAIMAVIQSMGPANQPSFSSLLGVGGIFLCPAGIALLTFFIWWIVVIHRYKQCFDFALRVGRRHQSPATSHDVIDTDGW